MPNRSFGIVLVRYDEPGLFTVGQIGRTRTHVTTGYQERMVFCATIRTLDIDGPDMRYAVLCTALRQVESLAQCVQTERKVIAQIPPAPG